MSVKNITNVEHKLFGLCCLEGEERDRIRAIWDSRFAPKTAFWVDAGDGDCMSIMVQFRDQLASRGITNMAGEKCIVALFLDFSVAQDPDRMKELYMLPRKLQEFLGCSVVTVLQFGHLGVLDRVHNKVPIENALQAVKLNSELLVGFPRLYLVATPFLGAEVSPHWKSVVVLLDVLRRDPHPNDALPQTPDGNASNDVGFLRYTEFLAGSEEELRNRIDALRKQLGGVGEDLLSATISTELSRLEENAKRHFVIDAKLQPQHPDMVIKDKGFLNCELKKAQKGNHKAYNAAVSETRLATEKTAKQMKENVLAFFRLPDAAAKLTEFREESKIGIDCFEQREKMHRMFDDLNSNGEPRAALLPDMTKYKAEGYGQEMGNFLRASRDRSIFEARRAYVKLLREAYDAISDEELAACRRQLQEELNRINTVLAERPKENDWVNEILYAMPAMSGDLTCGMQHTSKVFFMLQEAAYRKHEKILNDSMNVSCYWIENHSDNGMVKTDDAPMKAMRLAVGDCSPEFLKELIPGVEV